MMVPLILVVFLQSISYSFGAEWSYQNQENWPESCQGNFQSPIDLSAFDSTLKSFDSFSLIFDNEDDTVDIINNGHSVEIRLKNTTTAPVLSGGGLEGEYILDAFHFHWGAEHTLEKHRFPLEGHFVYFARKHKTLQNASKNKNGIAVLGVLYNALPVHNPFFDFTSMVPSIAHKINEPLTTKLGTRIRNLLPLSLRKFYRYEGSLTTPGCNEVVTWTVFLTPSFISPKQLEELTSIKDGSGNLLKLNYRNLQKRNLRPVYQSTFF